MRGDVVIFLWNFFLIATQVELFSSQHIHYEKDWREVWKWLKKFFLQRAFMVVNCQVLQKCSLKAESFFEIPLKIASFCLKFERFVFYRLQVVVVVVVVGEERGELTFNRGIWPYFDWFGSPFITSTCKMDARSWNLRCVYRFYCF